MDLLETLLEIMLMMVGFFIFVCVVFTAGFYAWKYLMWLFQ